MSKERKHSFAFVTLGATNDGTTATPAKKFEGVASVKLLAINPNMKELVKFGFKADEEPKYTNLKDKNGLTYNNIRVIYQLDHTEQIMDDGGKTIYVQRPFADEDKSIGSFFITLYQEPAPSQTGKMMCVDKIGRMKWIDKALADAHELPTDIKSLPVHDFKAICPDYIVSPKGWDKIVMLVKKYLGIRDKRWDNENKTFVDIEDLEKRMVAFDDPQKIWKGNLKEFTDVMKMFMANNDGEKPQFLKIMLGTKVNDKGYVAQVAYGDVFLSEGDHPSKKDGKYYDFARALENDAQSGRHESVSYSAEPAHEIGVAPTDLSAGHTQPSGYSVDSDPNDDLPF